jgi:hypothetical protein
MSMSISSASQQMMTQQVHHRHGGHAKISESDSLSDASTTATNETSSSATNIALGSAADDEDDSTYSPTIAAQTNSPAALAPDSSTDAAETQLLQSL